MDASSFSPTFFQITAGEREMRELVEEYYQLPVTLFLEEGGDECRERALWLLEKTGVSIFYRKDGTLDSADNGIPDNDSHPVWDKLPGGHYDDHSSYHAGKLNISGVRPSCLSYYVWCVSFDRYSARCTQGSAAIARLPILA